LFFADLARQYEEIFLIATGHQVAMAWQGATLRQFDRALIAFQACC
jgi:hypothetical protein